MVNSLHFLRPFWLFALLPLLMSMWLWRHKQNTLQPWRACCDPHILNYLLPKQSTPLYSISALFLSLFFIIISLAGPSYVRLSVPTYQSMQAQVLLLDLSEAMLEQDLSPNRLTRAKFKLQDILKHKDSMQRGLIVYTAEPFVVSPLTRDGATITALLNVLSPDIMPIQGENLSLALEEAYHLLQQGGFKRGDILVLTATAPSQEAIQKAKDLARKGVSTSILPLQKQASHPNFKALAEEGLGEFLTFLPGSQDIEHWINKTKAQNKLQTTKDLDFPLWRDEGRWFLIPALLFLLPSFRRGWLQRAGL